MRPAACVLLLALASCERVSARSLGPPARLVAGRGDTIIVNSLHTATLPVQVLDDAGHPLPPQKLRFERVSGDSVSLSSSGQITCERRGDAGVRVTLGTLARQFALLCRPIKGFRFVYGGGSPLVVGDAPRELQFVAVGADGTPERMLAGTLSIADSRVAELRGLTVVPRSPGETMVELDLGECTWAMGVTVYERVASPSALRAENDLFLVSPLRLVDGERRGWRLPRGEYHVTLLTQAGVDTKLELGTTAMNCAPWNTGGQDYHCIALRGASVDVKNPRRAGGGGELYGELFAERMDLPHPSRAARPSAPHRARKRMCPMLR
ncbi:MAG TPA: hypothetical protein VF461_21175 [Gemmatimonadaceae bacterium]